MSTGQGATVAVIDTGAETSHPELADRVLGAASFDGDGSAATTDSVGHGTHVASLACGAGNNGIGLAGAGLRCQMLILKSDFSDSSVAKAIVYAVDHGADAINMSFGTDPGPQPSLAVRDAVDYAFAHNVVMAAAAADSPIAEQGYPANLLQPTGTGPNLAVGKGLSVTAADASDARASFAGQGSQISLAAYGAYDAGPGAAGRPGSSAPSPPGPTSSRPDRSGCPRGPVRLPHHLRQRRPLRLRAGHLDGDADGRGHRRAGPPPQPRPHRGRDRAPHQGDRAPPRRRLDRRAGLGDPRRRRRADPRGEHRPPRAVLAGQAAGRAHGPAHDHRALERGRQRAAGRARVGHRALRALARDRRRAVQAPVSTTRTARLVTLRRGGRYRFYSVAIDHAGNREPAPKQADARIARRR